MSKSPAFQFYPNDWLGSTNIMLMSPAEEGAYIRLLAIAWNSEDCGLPDDDNQLASLSRLCEEWLNGSALKIRKCFIKKRGRLYNLRLLDERRKQEEWKEKSRQGGVESSKNRHNSAFGKELAEKRWGKNPCEPNANQMRTDQCEPNANSSSSFSSSSSLKKEKNITTIAEYDEIAKAAVASSLKQNFDIWMKAFPALDLETETTRALSWLLANPKNKKTNFTRFLRNWMSRAQEKAPRAMQSGPKSMKQIIAEEGL